MAELMDKQPRPIRIPTHDQASTDRLVLDLLRAERHEHVVPRRASRATRAAGVVTGALVLFASVATAAALAGNRPAAHVPPTGEQLEITGVTALRPDLLREQLRIDDAPAPERNAGVAEPSASPLAADVPETGTAAPSAVSSAPAAGNTGNTGNAETTGNAVPATPRQRDVATVDEVGPLSQVEVVRAFYSLLPGSPAAAAELLGPGLLDGAPGDFALSWASIRSLTLHSATARPDGSVLAVVSMEELTGGQLRIEQLFRFADAVTPRITGTEVLSALRS
ncbi:hypothetical protein [Umezawaea beigongshangensis]|uniref:hypothetical protein n=1 Tax=Umezawaea beigongshangensis TaxID=2780383 RepID=UPI0018F193FC|nr:hypothetical protein [Umezawaea beigongshangensis]